MSHGAAASSIAAPGEEVAWRATVPGELLLDEAPPATVAGWAWGWQDARLAACPTPLTT